MNIKKFRQGRGPQYVASGLAAAGLLLGVGLIEEVPADAAPVEVKYAGDYLIEDAPSVDRCEEDEPCWDCEVMGNGLCGPAETYLDAYNWCDAYFGLESEEAMDCQVAALDEWHPDWREVEAERQAQIGTV